ncbi:hypothetical protein SNEBB_001488 [Seison nebaliae]|nr:hypothetical protein SNEBB_001488 [Seison nebaliae]
MEKRVFGCPQFLLYGEEENRKKATKKPVANWKDKGKKKTVRQSKNSEKKNREKSSNMLNLLIRVATVNEDRNICSKFSSLPIRRFDSDILENHRNFFTNEILTSQLEPEELNGFDDDFNVNNNEEKIEGNNSEEKNFENKIEMKNNEENFEVKNFKDKVELKNYEEQIKEDISRINKISISESIEQEIEISIGNDLNVNDKSDEMSEVISVTNEIIENVDREINRSKLSEIEIVEKTNEIDTITQHDTTKLSMSNKRRRSSSSSDTGVTENHSNKRMTRNASTISVNYRRLNNKRSYGSKFTKNRSNRCKRQVYRAKLGKKTQTDGTKCFRCNEEGHWATNCPQKIAELAMNNINDDLDKILENDEYPQQSETTEHSSQLFETKELEFVENEPEMNSTNNLEKKREECSELGDEILEEILKKYFKINSGFHSFQIESIRHILEGKSTLCVVPPASGKSLIYQFASFLLCGDMWKKTEKKEKILPITLVISPLVSLMDDQISNAPNCLNIVTLHSSLTEKQRENTLNKLDNDLSIHCLMISPEMVWTGATTKNHILHRLCLKRRIAFVCMDEAHCISHWSYNFRVIYLRVCQLLRDEFNVDCFLALTATCTREMESDIVSHIGNRSVIRFNETIRNNIFFTVSFDEDRNEALIQLLKRWINHKNDNGVAIIYCSRRNTCDFLLNLLRMDLAQIISPEMLDSYHAGKSTSNRKQIYKKFMKDKIRIMIATIAFGMGIDKSNVRLIIHYNISSNIEAYVQETGRAGRDMLKANAHLFLSKENHDSNKMKLKESVELNEAKRHINSTMIDLNCVKQLFRHLFQFTCRCSGDGTHERFISIEKSPLIYDVKIEVLETILTHLEMSGHIKLLKNCNYKCEIYCYKDQTQIEEIFQKFPIIKEKSIIEDKKIKFNSHDIINCRHLTMEELTKELNDLQYIRSVEGKVYRSGINVQWSDSCIRCEILNWDLVNNTTTINHLSNEIFERINKISSKSFSSLIVFLENMRKFGEESVRGIIAHHFDEVTNKEITAADENIRRFFNQYFITNDENFFKDNSVRKINLSSEEIDEIRWEIKDLLQLNEQFNEEKKLSARAIARIFHGIGSPCYPVETWGKVKRFWRRFLHIDFHQIQQIARQILWEVVD